MLADPVHGWSHLLAELGALLGVSAPVTGAGDANDPWRVPIAESGRSSLALAAWRDGDALRVGLRASSEGSLWGVHVHAALIAVELPAGGEAVVLSLADRFGDDGLVGVAAVSTPDGPEWTVDLVAVSCRAGGRGAVPPLFTQSRIAARLSFRVPSVRGSSGSGQTTTRRIFW